MMPIKIHFKYQEKNKRIKKDMQTFIRKLQYLLISDKVEFKQRILLGIKRVFHKAKILNLSRCYNNLKCIQYAELQNNEIKLTGEIDKSTATVEGINITQKTRCNQ